MHPILTNAVKAARKAGNIITRASQDVGSLKIQSKTYNDFVTEVDRAAEREIIETLKAAYPDYGFIGEKAEIPIWNPIISGLSIRSMAPQTFCIIFRNTAFPSRCNSRAS